MVLELRADTPVRVVLMLRAEEAPLPGSPTFCTLTGTPPSQLGVSPHPETMLLSRYASSASPTLTELGRLAPQDTSSAHSCSVSPHMP